MIDNRVGLKPGYVLESSSDKYTIINEIGRGANSIVYEGYYIDDFNNKHMVRIKELAPYVCRMNRKLDAAFEVDDDEKEYFMKRCTAFKEAYSLNVSMHKTPGFTNYTVNSSDLFETNNTLYNVMNCDEGFDYEKYDDLTLKELFQRIRTLTNLIGEYHKLGYLLLDIKPANIFVLPETEDIVKFFDFDSLVAKEDIINLPNSYISYSEGYAAHELKNKKKELISETTDIYAIGAIVFTKLWGREPKATDCRLFSKFDFENMQYGDKTYDSKLYDVLTDFLRRTLSTSAKVRIKSTDEVNALLENLIVLSDLERCFINSSSIIANTNFIGRTTELESIHEALNQKSVVILSGAGGIGKTELVKFYVSKYGKDYDNVIFASYVVDIKSMINDDNVVSINNFHPSDKDNENDYFWLKIRKLKEICNEKTLFVIDNLNNLEDENLSKLLTIGCKFLITIRRDGTMLPYKNIKIEALDYSATLALFYLYYTRARSVEDEAIIESILRFVDCHTYTVELIAKQMMVSHIDPLQMWNKLNDGTVFEINEKISQNKDGNILTGSAIEHIGKLFDFAQINDKSKIQVLTNAALLITNAGISIEEFKKMCEFPNYDTINGLIEDGWFINNRETDKIHVHPLVSEILARKFMPNAETCSTLIKNIMMRLEQNMNESGIKHQDSTDLLHYASFVANRLIASKDKSTLTFHFLNQAAVFLKGMYVYKTASEISEWVCKYMPYIVHDIEFEINAYENYADIKLHENNYVLAESFYLKALSLSLQYFGKEHPYVAKLYNEMGKTYINCGDYDMAVISMLKAFAVRKKLVNKRGYSKDLLEDMGLLYFDLSNNEKLLNYYKIEIVGQFQLLNGRNANDVILNICNAKEIVTEDIKLQILNYYDDALNKRIESYTKLTMDSATAIHNMGVLYDIFEEQEMANKLYWEALDIKMKLMGEEHISCAITYENLGNNAFYKQQYDYAIPYYDMAYAIYKEFFGENSKECKRVSKQMEKNYSEKSSETFNSDYRLKKGIEDYTEVITKKRKK